MFKMKWVSRLVVGLLGVLCAVSLGRGVGVFQAFNEAILRPTAVVLDIAMRIPRALYGGFRAAAGEAGADRLTSSVIAGVILIVIAAGLVWVIAWGARKLRVKEPSPFAIRTGAILFWLGYVIGAYFLGLTVVIVYMAYQSDDSFRASGFGEIIGFTAGTAALYPVLGCAIRYMLGGMSAASEGKSSN